MPVGILALALTALYVPESRAPFPACCASEDRVPPPEAREAEELEELEPLDPELPLEALEPPPLEA